MFQAPQLISAEVEKPAYVQLTNRGSQEEGDKTKQVMLTQDTETDSRVVEENAVAKMYVMWNTLPTNIFLRDFNEKYLIW